MASDTDIERIQEHPDYRSYLKDHNGDISLALQDFQSNHPTLYEKFSRVIYRDASDDPWWQARNQAATRRVNQGLAQKLDKLSRTERLAELKRIQAAELSQEAREFTTEFPQKAQEYRDRNEAINRQLSVQESNLPPQSATDNTHVEESQNSSPTAGAGIIVIQTHSFQNKTPETDKAYERTREYRGKVRDAGMFTLSAEEQAELSALHPRVKWDNTDASTANNLLIRGVDATEFEQKIRSSNVLTRAERHQLTNIKEILKLLYAADAEMANDLREVNLYPQIVIERRDPIIAPLPDNSGALALNPIGNTVQPLLNVATGEAKKRASKLLTDKLAGKLAKEGVKVGVKTATKAAASTTAAEAGALAGTGIFPGVGTAIGLVAGWIAGSLVSGALEFLAKRKDDLRDLTGALLVIGVQVLNIIGAIIGATITAVTAPIVIILIVIPMFIMFSIYIINTSAWVVPPWGGFSGNIIDDGVIDSAFIDVTKTVSPSSINNDGLPLIATYTITVYAEQSALTNISFDDICSSIKAGTPPTNPGCPPATNITINGVSSSTFPPPAPQTITPGTPVIITYQKTFATLFSDSRITDTFTVTADAEGIIGEVSAATAVVTIGSPPGPGQCADFGLDITNSFASRIPNGNVKLLPIEQRQEDQCIVPTILAIHWSGGSNDNPEGNDRTYSTLDGNGLDCQFGTDTNDAQIWQALYQNGVERPQCAGGQDPSGVWWNDISVHIEMAGVSFTNPAPPPNLDQLEITYQTACAIKEQYSIPWTQLRGHYEMTPGKTDPGKEFFENVFLPEIRNRCP